MKFIKCGVLILTLTIVSCATVKDQKELIKIERVITEPPAELLIIPVVVSPIDVDSATQKTVAEWVIKKEERSFQIEEKLKAIKKYYIELKDNK